MLGIQRLQEAYSARFADYPKGITVPAIVEVSSGLVVTNDDPQITLDFSTEWTAVRGFPLSPPPEGPLTAAS